MSPAFHLLPATASTAAERFNALALGMTILCTVVVFGVVAVTLVFCIRYRAGAAVLRSAAPARKRGLELAWIALPLLLFFGVFAWGAADYAQLYRAPATAIPIYVVAKQWMWKVQHASGRREIGELHLPAGQPAHLILTSQDVIHSFFVPAFRIKQDLVPGRYTSIAVTPTRPGVYHLFCAEFCGTGHAVMTGRIVVLQPAAFARWLRAGPAEPGLASRGFALFRRYGCSGCHLAGSTVHAPDLHGLLGRRIHLQDGRSLIADDTYVRDSILLPSKDIVAGYPDRMPSFAGQIGEDELAAILAYLKESAHDQRPGPH